MPPVLLKVYCCDHTYTTIRVPVGASVREVVGAVADKLGSAEDLLLVGLSSAGGESGGISSVLIKWLEVARGHNGAQTGLFSERFVAICNTARAEEGTLKQLERNLSTVVEAVGARGGSLLW